MKLKFCLSENYETMCLKRKCRKDLFIYLFINIEVFEDVVF